MNVKSFIKDNRHEVKDTIYLVLLQGLNYIAPLIVMPYLMVVLGAEHFGHIGFSLAVCQYLLIIVDFGFNLSATKKIALEKDNKENVSTIFTNTVYAKVILLFFSFLILTALSAIPSFATYRLTMLAMFTMVVGNAFLFVFLFQGIGKIRLVAIVNCIAKLSVLPLTFVFVKNTDDHIAAALIQGSVAVIAALISITIIIKNRWVSLKPFNWQGSVAEIKDSFPLFLSWAATSIYTACFVIILGYFASPVEVGKYSATERIMRALCFGLLSPTLQSFFPKISREAKEHKEHAENLAKRLLIFISGGMSLICIAMLIVSPYVEKLLGPDYAGTEVLFRIMAFTPIFIGIGGIIGQLMLIGIGNEHDKRNFKFVYYITAIVAIVSVLMLTPFYAATGAAVSLLITEATVACGMSFFNIKRVSDNV